MGLHGPQVCPWGVRGGMMMPPPFMNPWGGVGYLPMPWPGMPAYPNACSLEQQQQQQQEGEGWVSAWGEASEAAPTPFPRSPSSEGGDKRGMKATH